MKKVFSVLVLGLVLISIVVGGCKKDESYNNNENSKNIDFNNFTVAKKNSMLSFSSVSDYQKALTFLNNDEKNSFAKWNNKIDFKNSLSKAKKSKSVVYGGDDILSQFLNNKGDVEIQGKIFSLDFNDSIVKVYYSFSNYNNSQVDKVYSFDDEVLTMEFGSKKELDRLKIKNHCAPYWNPDYRYLANRVVKYKIAYYKLGIYFTLVAKSAAIGSAIKKVNIDVSYSWRNTLGKSDSGKQSKYRDGNGICKNRVYSKFKKLTSYSITADFTAKFSFATYTGTWSHSVSY